MVMEQQGDLPENPHSIAHCVSADFRLGAGSAKQIDEQLPGEYLTNCSRINYCTYSTWVMTNLSSIRSSSSTIFTSIHTTHYGKR